MKKIFLTLIALSIIISLSAQDFIRTTAGEIIYGQIIEVTDTSITYQTTRNGFRVTNTISTLLVADFGTLPEDELAAVQTTNHLFEEPSRFRVAITLAYARRLGRDPEPTGIEEIDAMNLQIRNGVFWETEWQYFFNHSNGIALNLNGNHTRAQYEDFSVFQHIFFAGPAWATRHETSNFRLTGSIAVGAMWLHERIIVPIDNWGNIIPVKINLNGVSVGTSVGIGAEYRLSSTFGVGLRAGYTTGSISRVKIGKRPSVQLDEPLSLSNFFIGTVFSFTAR